MTMTRVLKTTVTVDRNNDDEKRNMKPALAVKKTEDKYSNILWISVAIIIACFEVTSSQFLKSMPYFIFLGGVLTASLLALQKNINRKTLSSWGIPITFAVLLFMPGKHENNYGEHLTGHVIAAIAVYLFLFPICLRKSLLPPVNGQVVFYFNILFWYLLYSNYVATPVYLLVLFAAGTLICGYFAFRPEGKTKPIEKLLNYLWYMTLLIMISLIQFSRIGLSGIADVFDVNQTSFWQMFLAGIDVTYLAINIGVLFSMGLSIAADFSYIPVTRNKESLNRGLQIGLGKVANDAEFLENRYVDRYLTLPQAFFLYIVQGILFVTNDRYHFMPQFLLSSLVIAFASLAVACFHFFEMGRLNRSKY